MHTPELSKIQADKPLRTALCWFLETSTQGPNWEPSAQAKPQEQDKVEAE